MTAALFRFARILWLVPALLLVACGSPINAEQDILSVGGSHPEAVVANFFEDLNSALQDPEIIQPETRLVWAERLASHFAPSERVDQRALLQQTLRAFAGDISQLDADQQLSIEIYYTDIELVRQVDNQADVRLTDAEIQVQQIRITADNRKEILFNQTRPLADVIGLTDDLFPVLRVNGRWFMTER